jgi:thiamine biosynthesis lipoprotein
MCGKVRACKFAIRGLILIGLLWIPGGPVQATRLAGFRQQESVALGRFTFTEYHMGVDTRLVVYAPTKEKAETACAAAFEKIAQLDTMMSDYQIHSELMLLCDQPGWGAGAKPVKVSPELFRTLQESVKISRLTNGLFDVTVGPLVRLWRKAKKTGILPTEKESLQAKAKVGWKKLRLDEKAGTASLAEAGMKLDLGAIGKGYADDAAQQVLKANGITRALVDMGGDIVVSDPPPGEIGWTIDVPNAMPKGGSHGERKDLDEHIPKMQISNCAISTSGDTEEFVIIGGRRYSHVINPHTGWALTHRVQATVIGPKGLLTDPISTAMTLVGPKARKRLEAAYPGMKVFVKVLR